MTSGTPASKHASRVAETASGRVKSTATSQPAGPAARPSTTSWPALLEAPGRAPAPTLPRDAEEADPHVRSASAGLTRATAARNCVSRGPIPAAESAPGAKSSAAAAATSSGVDRLDPPQDRLVDGDDLGVR